MSEFNNLSPEDSEYVLNLPYHLAEAGMASDLRELLTDFEFIEPKNSTATPQPLIEDYDLAVHPNIQIPEPTKANLRLIQGAVRLSANALTEDIPLLRKQNGFLRDLTDAIASVNSFCHFPKSVSSK